MEETCFLSKHNGNAGWTFIFKSLAFFGINFLCVYKSVSQKHNSTIKGFCYITGPVVYEFIICITSDLWILECGYFSMGVNTSDQITSAEEINFKFKDRL